jgi:hypothetical protein
MTDSNRDGLQFTENERKVRDTSNPTLDTTTRDENIGSSSNPDTNTALEEGVSHTGSKRPVDDSSNPLETSTRKDDLDSTTQTARDAPVTGTSQSRVDNSTSDPTVESSTVGNNAVTDTTTSANTTGELKYEIFREVRSGASILNRYCIDLNTNVYPS